jgi:LPS-assembly protein
MNSRIRFLTTMIGLFHLFVVPPLVTSQLHAAQTAVPSALPNAPSAPHDEDVNIKAIQQEKKGHVYELHGDAEIHYLNYLLKADDVTYDSDTGQCEAEGHVVLDGGPNDEHIEAKHGSYNLRSETGRFEQVRGGIGVKVKETGIVLTSSNPFSFTGKVVEKTSSDHYVVYDGTVTTCELPRPKWQFNARRVVVDVGGNASIYHSTFRIDGVPILYFPFATHPAQKTPRQSGFLIPNIGRSSIKGNILGESVFLALSRTMDATIGAEYFSYRGWAPQGQFRARPSESSFVDLNFFSVLDRGYGNPSVNQGGGEVHLTAADQFGNNYRTVADIDYLSSYVFRLAFNEIFTQAVNSEVKSSAFISHPEDGYYFNASMRRYQDFESTTSGDVITILHAPSFDFSGVDHPVFRTPFYWSYDASFGGLNRAEPGFSTASLVGRFDVSPTISLPLLLHGWSLRPEIALRDTIYTQRLLPQSGGTGVASSDPIDRRALEGAVELRPPAVDRVFDRPLWGRKWKHAIEPQIVYRYVTGVDNFPNILRFDERDVLSNTNEFEYRLVNRLYSKRIPGNKEKCAPPGMPALYIGGAPPHSLIPWERRSEVPQEECSDQPQTREVLTWELAQKYFLNQNFGGALVAGLPNVFTTTVDLTGIAFLTSPHRLSPLISRLRYQATSRVDIEWSLDYDFFLHQINQSTALVNYRFGSVTLGGGDAFLQAPGETVLSSNNTPVPVVFNQFRLLLGYGHLNKQGFSGAANIGFDENLNFLQYASIQTTYNWDCCGINLEYRRFALGSVRNENQFRFTFALANIAAFGNLRREARLY